MATLCATDPRIREHLEENVAIFNGKPGDPRSFDLLDKLLSQQVYRLAHWRVSSEEINYRRFFDINSLAAIRVEDPVVFEEAHRLVLKLLDEGKVTGFRVDHPDGLAYPARYFRLLQDARILQKARALAERRGEKWEELEPAVRDQLERELRARGASSQLFKPLFVVAEKILGGTERLPESWAVRGTDLTRVFGGGDADRLAARGKLGDDLKSLSSSGRVNLVTGFCAERVEQTLRLAEQPIPETLWKELEPLAAAGRDGVL